MRYTVASCVNCQWWSLTGGDAVDARCDWCGATCRSTTYVQSEVRLASGEVIVQLRVLGITNEEPTNGHMRRPVGVGVD